jgi:hypothetical protein
MFTVAKCDWTLKDIGFQEPQRVEEEGKQLYSFFP